MSKNSMQLIDVVRSEYNLICAANTTLYKNKMIING